MEQKVNMNLSHPSTSATRNRSELALADPGPTGRRRMAQPRKPGRQDKPGASAETRLIARLAATGAYLSPAADGRDAFMVVLPGASTPERGGVSLGGGAVASALVTALVAAGTLERDAASSRPRLVLSAAGHARAKRQASPDAPWLAQHAELGQGNREVNGEMMRVVVNHAESPLAWLRRRRERSGEAMIDAAAFAAGERLRADMTRAQMLPRVTASWEPAISRGDSGRMQAEPGDLALAARQRVMRALAAAGDEFAGVLTDVCGFLKGLEQVERERGWPARSGKLILRMALARLARHYGLSERAQGPDRAPTRAWRE